MLAASQCYRKWITDLNKSVSSQSLQGIGLDTQALIGDRKVWTENRGARKDEAGDIKYILDQATVADQFERDVAMWYGYLLGDGKGPQMFKRLFAALQHCGVFYRNQNGDWGDFRNAFGADVPVAAMFSHGSRILFQFPMSNSGARNVGNTVLAGVKGVTYDPLKALVDTRTFHTMRGKSTAVAVVTHGLLRVSGLASVAAIVNTPSKVYSAGDDRMWTHITQNDLHTRGMATHSTIQTNWGNPPMLGFQRALWFTEEKAGIGSNVRDAMMGRHYYKDVALGGVGNKNPFSGNKIDKNGGHGHFYVNYRAPQYKRFGCMLAGVEGSAPGVNNQYGKVHDAKATKGEFSATGGRKWQSLFPGAFYEPAKGETADVTLFVCDLSDQPTSASWARVNAQNFNLDMLSQPVGNVFAADWTTVRSRI